jgi:type IV pilus assembly protein PilA
MKAGMKRKQGQAMVEYIIIVAVVAVAALVVFGLFGDTIRTKMSGAISTLDSGDNADEAQADVTSKKSGEFLKNLDETGESQ